MPVLERAYPPAAPSLPISLGISARPAGSCIMRLHHFRKSTEGGVVVFVAVHESLDGPNPEAQPAGQRVRFRRSTFLAGDAGPRRQVTRLGVRQEAGKE
jgi:hypothetical protein